MLATKPPLQVGGRREAKSGEVFSRLEGGGGRKGKILLPFGDALWGLLFMVLFGCDKQSFERYLNLTRHPLLYILTSIWVLRTPIVITYS